MKQSGAANTLDISSRQIRRLWKAFGHEGPKSLISKKRGAPGNHRLPEGTKEKALELVLEKYPDFGPTFAHEKLTEIHGLKISVGSVRNLMVSYEIWTPKKIKKGRVFQMRQRRPQRGRASASGWVRTCLVRRKKSQMYPSRLWDCFDLKQLNNSVMFFKHSPKKCKSA